MEGERERYGCREGRGKRPGVVTSISLKGERWGEGKSLAIYIECRELAWAKKRGRPCAMILCRKAGEQQDKEKRKGFGITR